MTGQATRRIVLIVLGMAAIAFSSRSVRADDWLDSQTVPELNRLVNSYFAAGKTDSALIIAKRAVKLARKQFGENHNLVAVSLNSQASLLFNSGHPIAARPLFVKALNIWEKTPPSDSIIYGAAQYNLATILKDRGDRFNAEQLYRSARTILEPRMDKNNPNLLDLLSNLADLMQARGRADSAIALYRVVLERQQATLPKRDVRLGRTWNNLGIALADAGRLKEAEEAYNKALTSLEWVLGPDDIEVGFALENLASVYVRQGKLTEAERLAVLARDVVAKRLGPSSLETIEIGYLQGIISHRKKQFDQAEKQYQQVRRLLEEVETSDGRASLIIPQVMKSLQELYTAMGETGKADAMAKEIRSKYPDLASEE